MMETAWPYTVNVTLKWDEARSLWVCRNKLWGASGETREAAFAAYLKVFDAERVEFEKMAARIFNEGLSKCPAS